MPDTKYDTLKDAYDAYAKLVTEGKYQNYKDTAPKIIINICTFFLNMIQLFCQVMAKMALRLFAMPFFIPGS